MTGGTVVAVLTRRGGEDDKIAFAELRAELLAAKS